MSLKILIADDDEESRIYLSKALTKYEHTPILCTNGHEAVNILSREDAPTIALLDWMMPDLTGPEVCKKLRADGISKSYLILLTARDSKEDILTGLRSGADDYITKPIKLDELQTRLEAAIRLSSLQTMLREKDEKILETSSRLLGLVNNLKYALLAEDNDRKVVFTNEAFCKLFKIQVDPQTFIGADCEKAAQSAKSLIKNPDEFISKIKTTIDHKKIIVGEEIEFASGSTFERDYVPTYSDGRLTSHLWVYRDITERKKLESNLKDAKIAAEKAGHAKSSFLASMSHEIRTPMNGIIGMCNLLLGSEHFPHQVERLKIIQGCGNSLLDLINDILDYSKMEADKVTLETIPFSIEESIREVLGLLQPKADEKQLELSFSLPEDFPRGIQGDVTRFKQILLNLVGNALKFTEKGDVKVLGKILGTDADGKMELRFSVQDSGIGISPDAAEKLFRPFTQADTTTTRKFGGTGLGLTICKGLCEKMGGKIWIESESGKGSTFHFTLFAQMAEIEITKESINPLSQFSETMGKTHPLRILIAEDNRVNQVVVTGLLGKLGYFVDVAGNGFEVLSCLKKQKYDLIFMDCHMPEMDGFEATRNICRQYAKENRPKIVALTASITPEDVKSCLAVGMDDFIAKPIQPKDLIRIISGSTKRDCSESSKQAPTLNFLNEYSQNLESPFNHKRFLENFVGLDDVVVEAVSSFLRQAPLVFEKILLAIEKKDAKALELEAHTLKGMISNFYAEPCRLLAWELEQIGQSAQVGVARAVSLRLGVELDRLYSALQTLSEERKAA